MPKKMKLALKGLKVQSFVTSLEDGAKTKIKGGATEAFTCPPEDCTYSCNSCAATCPGATCGASCGGTCVSCPTCETCYQTCSPNEQTCVAPCTTGC